MNKFIVIVMLTAMACLHPIALDMYSTSFMNISYDLHITVALVQYSFMIFLCGLSISQLIYGVLTDVFNRKAVLLSGIFLYILCSILVMLTHDITFFMIFRLFQAFGAACGAIFSIIVVSDFYNNNQISSVRATIAMGVSVVAILSPVIGTTITFYIGWRYIFLLQSILGIILFIFVVITINNNNKPTFPIKTVLYQSIHIIKNKLFISYLLSNSLQTAGMYLIISNFSIVIFSNYHINGLSNGIYYALLVGGYFLGNFTFKLFAKTYKDKMLFNVGCTMSALNMIIYHITHSMQINEHVCIASYFLMMFMFSSGYIFPTSASLILNINKNISGAISGILLTFRMLVSAILCGVFYVVNNNSEIMLMTALLIISIIVSFISFTTTLYQ